jgi:hypothetical protein
MSISIEERMATFEDTIKSTVNRFYGHGRVDAAGLDRDDVRSILRTTVWTLLVSRNCSREYVCSAIWNRARDLVRRTNIRAAGRVDLDTHELPSDVVLDDPWELVDLRMDLQTALDHLDQKDVQIVWTMAQEGRREAGRILGIPHQTLGHRARRARHEMRRVLERS